MLEDKITIQAEFDLEALRKSIANVKDIEHAEKFFEQLTEITKAKQQLAEIEDRLKTVEAEAKGLINAKAKALYGNDWKAIKGHGFKISRRETGDLFLINGKPKKEFIKIKESVDSTVVKAHLIKNDGKLPKGIEYNPDRGESITIRVENGND